MAAPQLSPRALLVGDAPDIREDVFHLAKTRAHLRHLTLEQRVWLPASEVLSRVERDRARAYLQLWQQSQGRLCPYPDFVFHLGDEPRGGWASHTTTANAIPTMRRAGGIYYSPWGGRQLLLRELYAAHGFPTFPALAREANVEVYRVFKPSLSYAHMRQALGNAQVVPQVGVFTAVALASMAKKICCRPVLLSAWLRSCLV